MRADERMLQHLKLLVAALCNDADLEVDCGDRWAYNPVDRKFIVSKHDLVNYGPDQCAGVLAHEIGHFFVSRYPLFQCRGLPAIASSHLMNALEDPRCEYWIFRRYPGTRRWLELYEDETGRLEDSEETKLPRFLQFCLLCLRDSEVGWNLQVEDEALHEALVETRDARRFYTTCLPPTTLSVDIKREELLSRYETEVLPGLVKKMAPSQRTDWEKLVLLRAWEAFSCAQDKILPVALALFSRDRGTVGRYLQDQIARQEIVQKVLDKKPVNKAVLLKFYLQAKGAEDAGNCLEVKVSEQVNQLATQLLEEILNRDIKTSRPTSVPGSGGRPQVTKRTYSDYRNEVSTQIKTLVEHMHDAIPPRLGTRFSGGFVSGPRIDLKRLMAFEADPRNYEHLWQRKIPTDRKDAAVLLLIDLSGSMRDEKIQSAVSGTVLVAETLDSLNIPFAIYGFQDVLVPIKPFHALFDGLAKDVITELPLEVLGKRPGGNNVYGNNDDGPCLLESAEELMSQPVRDKILLVISDGHPEGKHSTKEDLVDAVSLLTERDRDLTLVGIGIGPKTEHVSQYYPNSVASIPLGNFAEELGQLLLQSLAVY